MIRKLMFLSSLASMASMGPRLMPVIKAASGGGDTQALVASLQQALKTPNAAGDVQIGDEQLAQLQGLVQEAPAGAPGNSNEVADLSREIQSMGHSNKSVVLEKLLHDMSKASSSAVNVKEQAGDLTAKVAGFYQERQNTIRLWGWLLPILFIAAGVAFHLMGQPYWLRNVGETGYAASRTWLWLLAVGTAGWALMQHANPWPLLPSEVYIPGILWLMGSAWQLHLLDPNYPSWNSMLKGLTAPLLSMGFALALPKLLSTLPI